MLNTLPRRLALFGAATVLTALTGGAAFAAPGHGDPSETVHLPDGSCQNIVEGSAAGREAKGEPQHGTPCKLDRGAIVELHKGDDVRVAPAKQVGKVGHRLPEVGELPEGAVPAPAPGVPAPGQPAKDGVNLQVSLDLL